MEFFTSPEDLRGWVKSQPTADEAAAKILDMFKDENSENKEVTERCKEIYQEEEDGDASKASNALFGALAKRNVTKVKGAKIMSKITKVAQSAVQSRQRNNWVRGNRNKFNRVVDGFNEGTPWREERDRYYNFTHYYTDAISFDTDPNHVYSGEAIWRMYIMDKFTPESLGKDGRWVGGYINDRFHKFPTAGTPANPDVDRFQGNQMGLAPGEKTRKPRPHQYSTERRLEESRGNETYDLDAVVANAKSVVKLAVSQPKEKEDDKVYNVFKDTLDMREAGIEYPTMLEAIAEHYSIGIMHVAEIDKVAQKLKAKHEGIMYVKDNSNSLKAVAQMTDMEGHNMQINDPNGADGFGQNGQTIKLPTGTIITKIPATNMYEIVEDPVGGLQGTKITFADMNFQVAPMGDVQNAAMEVGLVDDQDSNGQVEPQTLESTENFPVQDVTQK